MSEEWSQWSPAEGFPFRFRLNAQRNEVELQTPEPITKLTTQGLDDVIRLLGLVRSSLRPPVPLDMPPSGNLPTTPATNWRVAQFDPDKECPIALRTDGYGWLVLLLTPEGRVALINTLTGADRQPHQPEKTRH